MTTSDDEFYYYTNGSKQSKTYKAAKNAERRTIRLPDGTKKRAYLSEYGSMMDRPATPPTPEATWKSWEIDKVIEQARKRYTKLDEGYERVQCGYVYQMRQRDVHYLSKVGFSGDPEGRLKAPNTFLEVHREFIIVKAWPVKDKAKAEAHVHRFLADKRVGTKELFRGHYAEITDLIEVAMMEYYDDETG